jgi:MFS family permease
MGKVASAIRNPQVVIVTGILSLTMFMYQSVTGFLPTYLAEVKGISPSTAAVVFGLFFASAIGVQFLSGIISDRYSQRLAMVGFMGLSVPAFVGLTFAEGLLALVGVVVVLSCMLGGFPPAHAYATRAVPAEIQGSGYGLVRTLYIVFGALGPLSVGVLADFGLFNEAFLLLGSAALFTCLISVRLPTL